MKHEQKLKQALQELDDLKEKVEGLMNHDKLSDLKEAHKNGAVIQYKNRFHHPEWLDVFNNNPIWHEHDEYRIKPEEEPKVGDVVQVNGIHGDFTGIVTCIDSNGHFQIDGFQWYDSGKLIAKKDNSLGDDIQQLISKYPQYNITITVEDNV